MTRTLYDLHRNEVREGLKVINKSGLNGIITEVINNKPMSPMVIVDWDDGTRIMHLTADNNLFLKESE